MTIKEKHDYILKHNWTFNDQHHVYFSPRISDTQYNRNGCYRIETAYARQMEYQSLDFLDFLGINTN